MLIGVLLAGGRSSRMGRDKARLRADGETLLRRALSLLERAGAERLLISGREEAGYEGVVDRLPLSGPPGGLYSVLEHLRREGRLDGSPLLVIPVDMPALQAPTLANLAASLGDARAARYQGEVFPCIFRAREDLHGYLREVFEESPLPGGRRSMKALFDFCAAKEVPRSDIDERQFRNINTPEDWQEFSAR